MEKAYFEGESFENLSTWGEMISPGDYENCIFMSCDFSNASLSEFSFLECEFRDCNLTMTKLNRTCFRDVKFSNSRLLGLHFEDCSDVLISMSFESSQVELCSFPGLKLRNTAFRNSKIIEADFSGTDLGNSLFHECDLSRSVFMNTNLEKADFRTAFNYIIDPELNRIIKAKFSLAGLPGLLSKYDIDTD